ncbi:hypothetical protein M407DRAFT_241529 [Tulasnella calospora MUT 4182]|uniref:DUF4112 domain-containing protein n=1 Tax=Tulasnella calospora MUT 4182 TaxID=1051891 RepID=A0A0C3LEB8_9AGAM|nr:hypothetical protein M407DRAFT_241529 [Tulasnella calospora MUT 4182]
MSFFSGILSDFWTKNDRRRRPPGEEWDFAPTYGAFGPTYYCNFRAPKTNDEAQKLYNHCRTVAWYMDALPFVSQALPFRIGIDDVISLIPVWGDGIGFMLSLYQVYLAWLFGAPSFLLGRMLLNTIIDFFIGVIPVIGDFLDVIFKANLRNLALLEDWLIKDAPQYRISIPPSDFFLPRVRKGEGSWNRAAGDRNPKDKYRNPGRTTRLKPADLD